MTTSTSHPAPLRLAPVAVTDVHDGDSFTVALPLHGLWPACKDVEEYIRLAHCNAAELSTPEGIAARDAVAAWLADPARGELTAHGWGRDKYGRWLADIEDAQGAFLSAYVLTLPGSVPLALHEQLPPR